MSVAGLFELVAWLLSAVIAGWLVLDVVRVGRRYREEQLVGTGRGPDDRAQADHR